jgi:hypothetical protein
LLEKFCTAKIPLFPENGGASDFLRLAHLWSLRAFENSAKIGMTHRSPAFSRRLDPKWSYDTK